MKKQIGFTIVELLVVIVVIGILAAITIVSYAGISQRAVAASLESDLASAKKQLQIYQAENPSGEYPTANNCPSPGATEICLKASDSNSFDGGYSVNNSSNPKTFSLNASNGTTVYRITNDSAPAAVTDPYESNPNWILGIASTAMEGKYVRSTDLGSLMKYKTSNTAVVSPQGDTGLDLPNHPSNMVLVNPQDNPAVDFSEYPAHSACKAIDGRLPTMNELAAIYANRASYGIFEASLYWSATENSTATAYLMGMNGGVGGYDYGDGKSNDYYVRCVAG